jgi:hypothetical protein
VREVISRHERIRNKDAMWAQGGADIRRFFRMHAKIVWGIVPWFDRCSHSRDGRRKRSTMIHETVEGEVVTTHED